MLGAGVGVWWEKETAFPLTETYLPYLTRARSCHSQLLSQLELHSSSELLLVTAAMTTLLRASFPPCPPASTALRSTNNSTCHLCPAYHGGPLLAGESGSNHPHAANGTPWFQLLDETTGDNAFCAVGDRSPIHQPTFPLPPPPFLSQRLHTALPRCITSQRACTGWPQVKRVCHSDQFPSFIQHQPYLSQTDNSTHNNRVLRHPPWPRQRRQDNLP